MYEVKIHLKGIEGDDKFGSLNILSIGNRCFLDSDIKTYFVFQVFLMDIPDTCVSSLAWKR